MSVFTHYDATTSVVYCEHASKMLMRPYYIVAKPFEYYVGDKKAGVYIRVPLGYITDGASVPLALQRFIPAWGEYGQATVIHDYLCENLTVEVKGVKTPISRRTGDKIFYEAMGVLKVPIVKRVLFYIAVRMYSIFIAKGKAYKDPQRQCVQNALLEHYKLTGSFNFN